MSAHESYSDAAKAEIDGRADQVIVTHHPGGAGGSADRWLVTVVWGWAQTVVAGCDYDHHARLVALSLGAALDCEVDLGEAAKS